MRWAALVLMVLVLPLQAGADSLKIAARDDAAPFVWADNPKAALPAGGDPAAAPPTEDHLGFFWDICAKMAERAGFSISVQDVDAATRDAFLNDGKGDFDLLCDPTTLTLRRLRQFSDSGTPDNPKGAGDLSFLPILFVANSVAVPHAASPAGAAAGAGRLPETERVNPPGCSTLIERLRAPATPSKTEAKTERRPWIVFRNPPVKDGAGAAAGRRFEIWGAVDGTTSSEEVALEERRSSKLPGSTLVCGRTDFASHAELAKAFCTGEIARYVGDLEILRAAINRYLGMPGNSCDPDYDAATNLGYEPYALVVSSRNKPDLHDILALELYGMFADGTIERFYAGHFPGTEKSVYLKNLFLINGVPSGYVPRR